MIAELFIGFCAGWFVTFWFMSRTMTAHVDKWRCWQNDDGTLKKEVMGQTVTGSDDKFVSIKNATVNSKELGANNNE